MPVTTPTVSWFVGSLAGNDLKTEGMLLYFLPENLRQKLPMGAELHFLQSGSMAKSFRSGIRKLP